MARIFDNIDNDLLTTLRATMQVSSRSDFCVGYLNLRGWQAIDDLIAPWNPAAGQVCRVLVGMQRPPHEEIRELYRQSDEAGLIDNATASRLKTQFAAHLREQITPVRAGRWPACWPNGSWKNKGASRCWGDWSGWPVPVFHYF